MSVIDSVLSAEEERRLREVIAACVDLRILNDPLSVLRGGTFDDILMACQVLQVGLTAEQRGGILDLLIGMALRDGYLKFAENHALRFVGDVLGFSTEDVSRHFAGFAGRPLGAPGDPSSRSWWEAAERASSERRGVGTQGAASNGDRLRALAILGLPTNASIDEIRSSFRRLSQIHHPDKYQALGPAAVEAATETFRRIRDAYDTLSGSEA